MNKTTTSSDDNWVAYLGVVAFSAILGALLAWGYYYQQKQPAGSDQAYAKMATVRFQMRDFSVRATISLQSSTDDLEWINQNKNKLQKFLEAQLQDIKPEQLTGSGPEKIPQLQATLTEEINKKFPEARVQQVLFTEFLTAHDTQ